MFFDQLNQKEAALVVLFQSYKNSPQKTTLFSSEVDSLSEIHKEMEQTEETSSSLSQSSQNETSPNQLSGTILPASLRVSSFYDFFSEFFSTRNTTEQFLEISSCSLASLLVLI